MGNTCIKGSSAGGRYAARGVGGGGGVDEYTDGRGGGGYALPQMHAGEGISGMCSGGPGVVITGGQDGSAAVWRWGGNADRDNNSGGAAAGELIHRWDAHPKPVTRVAHLPNAGRVLTACRDGLVRAWSPGDTATPTTEFKGHTLTISGLVALEAGKRRMSVPPLRSRLLLDTCHTARPSSTFPPLSRL
jgi:WD40 repeat protein